MCGGQPGDQGVHQADVSSCGRQVERLDPVDPLQQDVWPGGAEEDQDLHQAARQSRGPGVWGREVPDQQLSAEEMSRGHLQSQGGQGDSRNCDR